MTRDFSSSGEEEVMSRHSHSPPRKKRKKTKKSKKSERREHSDTDKKEGKKFARAVSLTEPRPNPPPPPNPAFNRSLSSFGGTSFKIPKLSKPKTTDDREN